VRAQGKGPVTLGMTPNHIQRADTDRPGRTENRNICGLMRQTG
jgi:hypothetical protein